MGKSRSDGILLGVLHIDRCLLVRLLHCRSGRVNGIDWDDGATRIEPGTRDLDPARRRLPISADVDGEHVEATGGRVGLLLGNVDQRHSLRTIRNRTECVEDRARLLDHIGRRNQRKQQCAEHRGDQQNPTRAGSAASSTSFRAFVGEESHHCPFGCSPRAHSIDSRWNINAALPTAQRLA